MKVLYDVRRMCPSSVGATTEKVWYEVAKHELHALQQANDKEQYLNSLLHTGERWRATIMSTQPQMIPMPENLTTAVSSATPSPLQATSVAPFFSLDAATSAPSIFSSTSSTLASCPSVSSVLPSIEADDSTKVYWAKHSALKKQHADRIVQLRRLLKKLLSVAGKSKQQRLQHVIEKLDNALQILALKPESKVRFNLDVQTLHRLQAQIEKKFVPIMQHYSGKVESKKRNAGAQCEEGKRSAKRARTSPTAQIQPQKSPEFSLSLSPGNAPSRTPDKLNTRKITAGDKDAAEAQGAEQLLMSSSASETVSI